MARKYQSIIELYHKTVTGITAPSEWQRFLATACRNYRLPFDEQVLLFAQRPDAIAVLPIEGKNGWNERFGRWVNRGATGIAVFDGDAIGRSRLKYYFDISDTHESRFSRPVPLWQMEPAFEAAVVEALENSLGELDSTADLADALLSAASNAVEDHMPDYLAELKYCKEDSFLEELDDLNLEVIYRTALKNSVGYMLLARCGIDPSDYFTDDDFRGVTEFSTRQTVNALGVATGDIGQVCLTIISRTMSSLQRQTARQDRTVADPAGTRYPVSGTIAGGPKRSANDERTTVHDAGWLSDPESVTPAGAGSPPREIRTAAPEFSETAPQSDLHQPADLGHTERPSDGDPADRTRAFRADAAADGGGAGGDGSAEGGGSPAVDGADEQHSQRSGGEYSGAADLQLKDIPGAGTSGLPSFLNEAYIMAIIANREDDLVYRKEQIELFFSLHPDYDERVAYLKTAYPIRYTELIVDGSRIGYRPQSNGLLMWEGSYPSRTSESVFSWGLVVEWTAQLIDRKEYFIDTRITPPKAPELQQFSIFDLPAAEPAEQLSFMPRLQLPQQIIDEALCIGANDQNSRLVICAYFMKDHPTEKNAAFLQAHYRTNGAGFYVNERPYALWYNGDGIRIANGESAQGRNAAVLTWEQAAIRIRALLDMGRYMPQSELDRAPEYERTKLAELLALTARDMTAKAKEAGYLPTARLALAEQGGFPEIERRMTELLSDADMLQKITQEWIEFSQAYTADGELLRFPSSRPRDLVEKLLDLHREPVIFTAAEGHDPNRQFFISSDEIDQILRGTQDHRLAVYTPPQERAL